MAEAASPFTDWILSIGALLFGSLGTLFGVLSYFWNRHESRLASLTSILNPMVRTAQFLHRAIAARKEFEQLMVSFPQPEKATDAVHRVDELKSKYAKYLISAEEGFRESEAEASSKLFRFPDRIARMVRDTQTSLSECGNLLNKGLFDKADLQFAKFRDGYKKITSAGRGWRLADPLESISRRFRSPADEQRDADVEQVLTESEMNAILELVYKRATSQAANSFTVHPPKKLLTNPSLAESDNVVEELRESIFVVVFQDGESKMVSLPELVIFIYQLIMVSQLQSEVNQMMQAPNAAQGTTVEVKVQFRPADLMQVEMVKTLLGKIEFSQTPSDN